MPSIPGAKLVRITGDAAAWTGGTVLYAVYLFAGSDASSLILYDAASVTGTQVFEINTVANQGVFVDLSELGGITFPNTGVYADIGGTGAIGYVWLA